ncbi:MAG: hypothetical protein N4A62_05820 [Marinisporobacter sp.]|nr:hypothetical protein [Marinisporobacter sp.]
MTITNQNIESQNDNNKPENLVAADDRGISQSTQQELEIRQYTHNFDMWTTELISSRDINVAFSIGQAILNL